MKQSPVVRITKQFRFEAAHALWNYDGPCKNIHGHSYLLYVTIKGHPVDNVEDPKNGMVMDFSTLKKIVHELIIDPLDHALLVNADTPHKRLAEDNLVIGKVALVPYQPTCENMIVDFAAKISQALPPQVSLHSLRLHETTTAYAAWYADDQ